MKKSFQKTLLAASVGAAILATSAASFAGGNGTTNILFPYVKSDANSYTFISLVNRGYTPASGNSNGGYQFSYGMKPVGAPNFVGSTSATPKAADCEHLDGRGTTTANDLMQFEMSNRINLPAAFGDTTSAPIYWTGTTGTHGFLVVNSSTSQGATFSGATIYGEAIVIDTSTGLRVAYSSNNLNTTDASNPDFTIDSTGAGGGPLVASTVDPDGNATNNGVNVISWLQSPTVTTSWFVEPLGSRVEMTPSGNGGVVAAYNMYDSGFTQTGAYDNNERFWSGATQTTVRCVGVISRTNMLNPGVVSNTNNGGFGHLTTFNGDGASPTGGTVQTKNKSLVYKSQSSSALGTPVNVISQEASY